MKQQAKIILAGVFVVILLIIGLVWPRLSSKEATQSASTQEPPKPHSAESPFEPKAKNQDELVGVESSQQLVVPIAEFAERVTKKPFGIFITPENSPISPERFSGFHTGVDVEYVDEAGEIPVSAIADGAVVKSEVISGYGGALVIQHKVNGEDVTALYGHLNPDSLSPLGAEVTAGQQIGILGEGDTPATDGERKHLHFAIHKGSEIDLRGYVETKAELSAWLNPLQIF